jgi:hypothetical protein
MIEATIEDFASTTRSSRESDAVRRQCCIEQNHSQIRYGLKSVVQADYEEISHVCSAYFFLEGSILPLDFFLDSCGLGFRIFCQAGFCLRFILLAIFPPILNYL